MKIGQVETKLVIFDKCLNPNPEVARTIVWHCDIVVAKCIMHKGKNDGWENV